MCSQFYSGTDEGIVAADLDGVSSSDWNTRNLIFYPWLDKVDMFIDQDKCPISNYIKDWCANGYQYLSYDEVLNEITSILDHDDGEITSFSLGQSVQGRDIKALQIGSGGGSSSDVVLMVAGIHGDEKAAVAGALNLAVVFDNLYKTNSQWRHVLENHFRIVIVPCNNPDGYVSYTRNNSNNVDLNRNYEYANPDDGGPFSQPETRAIRDFVGNNTIKAYVGFHMGSNGYYLVEQTTEGINRHDYPYRDHAYMLGYTINETMVNEAKIFSNDNNRIRKIGDSATIMPPAPNATQQLHVMLHQNCPSVTFENQGGFHNVIGETWKSSAREMQTTIVQMAVVGMEIARWRYETLIPWGEGANLEFSYLSGGTSHYLKVDDNTDMGDGDSTWAGSNSAYVQRDLYTIPSLSGYSSGMTIGKVGVFLIAKGVSGPTTIIPALRTQSTFFDGTSQNLDTAYSRVNCTWSINPSTGTAWTNSDIDNLQIGQKASYAATRVTEAYAVVQYNALHG